MKTTPSGVEAAPAAQRLGHIAIRTGKPKEAIAFYEKTFGFSLADKHEDEGSRFSIFFLGGPPPHHVIELVWNWDEKEIAPGRLLSHIAFVVEDMKAMVATALANGGSMLEEPHMKAEGHWRCYVGDPDGMAIEFNELKRAAPAGSSGAPS